MTGKIISKYKELANNPEMREVRTTDFGRDFGGLAQGDSKTGEKGSTEIFVMICDEIKNIPADTKITYGRLVVNSRDQKPDPN